MNTFERITRARALLGVPERATVKEIRASYRKLIRKWHPDRCQEEREKCQEMSARLNEAYKVLTAYCNSYRFDFAEEEVKKNLPDDEWWLDRFGNDPVWGRGSVF